MIIFEAGFALDKRGFAANLLPIVTFSILGTLVSTLLIAPFVYFGARASFASSTALAPDFSYTEALAFSSLISAIDPVSTIAIFGKLGVDRTTSVLLLGESILNDAVAIVLYRHFSDAVIDADGDDGAQGLGDFIVLLGAVAINFILSLIVGAAAGLVGTVLVGRAAEGEAKLQVSLVLLFAYIAYELAETLHFSGIVAALACGVVAKRYAYTHMAEDARALSKQCFAMLATLFETVVFFMIGAATALYLRHVQLGFTIIAMIACMIGRAASVYGLSVPLNMKAARTARRSGGGLRAITRNQQHALWLGGLRGAVAFALVLSFPSAHRTVLVGTVAWVIFFTTLVGGAGSPYLLRRLGLADPAESARHNALEDDEDAEDVLGVLGKGPGREAEAAAELPAEASAFARHFRRLELRLLATGSTEAARAAASLGVSMAGGAEEDFRAPDAVPPPADAGVARPTRAQPSSPLPDGEGFTEVGLARSDSEDEGRSRRAGSPVSPRRRSPGRSAAGSDPAELTQTASAAARRAEAATRRP